MLYVIDHLKERESVLVHNLSRIRKARAKGEPVLVIHPVGKVHGRLANIPGVQYKEDPGLNHGGEANIRQALELRMSPETSELVRVWGDPIYGKLGVRPVAWDARRIAYIHWMICGKELRHIEVFHLNMLWAFNAADFFDEIHIRIAGDGAVPQYAAEAIQAALGGGKAKLDVKGAPNAKTWEWGTFNEFLDAVRPDSGMYYMHFKGTGHVPGSPRNKHKVFKDYGDFAGIAFWSYLMYKALFTIPPTDDRPAVCGVLHVNPRWAAEAGWDIRPYHASGSFQGYAGKALTTRHGEIEKRRTLAAKSTHHMCYFVEGLMTFLFPEKNIGRLCSTVIENASMYGGLAHVVPDLYAEFKKGPEYLICSR